MPATFNFPYHRVETVHPVQGTNLKLGSSWSYNSKPNFPPQRIFHLAFKVMVYYGVAGTLDLVTNPEINLGALESFYNLHLLHTEFTYPHPIYGDVLVKFLKPIQIPMGIPDGGGGVAGVAISLVEQPI